MDHLNNDRFYDEPIQRSATSGMAKVYGWMFLGLMLTAVMSIVTLATPLGYYVYNQPVMIGLMIAEFALVVFLSARVLKMNYGTAVVSFLAYALLNGITLSVIFFAYTGPSIAFAFLFTAGAFGIMSVYGLMTKNDLTSIGSFLFMGLIGIILASVVNMFLRSPGLYYAISYIGIAVFLGLTAYDTQKIKRYSAALTGTGREKNIAIIGALTLYLDFINLFLYLLRILGRKK